VGQVRKIGKCEGAFTGKKAIEINLIRLSGTFFKGEGKWMQSVSP
jgi:hypothetical protein